MRKRLIFTGFAHLLMFLGFAENLTKIVGVPPADGGRGLVRVSESEIRHYTGAKGEKGREVMISRDNGETWGVMTLSQTYPENFGGIPKEAPAITRNPLTGEFIRVQPINGYVFISQGGIDGKWGAVTKDGKLCFDWMNGDRTNLITLSGIMRNPTFVNGGKRILIPAHSGSSYVHISDDGGLTWTRSKSNIEAPPHKAGGIHKGHRWQNIGVEGTLVELNDKRLWILVRTSQDQYYESFSLDMGDTWSAAKPSRFWGTLTMPCINRLADGRLLMLWTNTVPLPENKGANLRGGEDAFTNRDSHHAALSHDDGKTWFGFREIILDEHRNQADYATFNGPQDRGKHQSEMVQLDKDRVLISLGQHKEHRKLVIFNTKTLYETSRICNFESGLGDWTIHSYIPQTKGHCAYNRKPSASLVDCKGRNMMQLKRLQDEELISNTLDVNYEKSGASWNFPNGASGALSLTFQMDKESEGTQISLTDRLFNACDETAEDLAVYTMTLKPGMKLGNKTLKAGKNYTITLKWKDVQSEDATCEVFVNNARKPAAVLPLKNSSPNGLSYVHLISKAENPDGGILIESVEANITKTIID